MTRDEYAAMVSSTVAAMLKRGFIPCIMIGVNKENDVIAQSIDPATFTPALTKAMVCKVVVGDILGDLPQ